ncbi:MAG TPA: LuxR C-terminal-related transcriptional regulator [Anaerolineales bacterium]|nr:LuxR C-terminal-related transcriptional regulator [Anaerolineales bacterium]
MTTPLLVTKLFVPPSRPELVLRPRLLDLLNGGCTSQLTLVSAPAGFGKTTLVAEWMKLVSSEAGAQVAWLSLDDQDNDLRRFLTYVLAGLSRPVGLGSAGEQAMARLDDPEPPAPETVLTPVINQIAAAPANVYLVLDDYHVIDAPTVNDAVAFLLDHLPPNLHLVVTTREDPLLPVSRLRSRGQLIEVRAADLRFSLTESAEFLNEVMGLDLGADDVAALEARTEGWVVGLQLAALSLKGQTDLPQHVRSFSGSNRLVLDYLVDEVLSRQAPGLQDFLLHTSILDRLSAPLCDEVTGQTGSQDTLDALDRANLFLIPLDQERTWFRYHHLFADLLRQRLRVGQPAVVPDLHARASLWFERQSMAADAIRHALAARDFGRVADLAEAAWPDWNTGYRSLQWLEWIQPLPLAILRERPRLCVACAQAHLNGGQLEAAEARLQDAIGVLRPNPDQGTSRPTNPSEQTTLAQLAMTRAYLAQARGDVADTLRHVYRALDLFPQSDVESRATVTLLLGLAHWTQGDLEAAYNLFSKALIRDDLTFITGAFVLAEMQTALGRLSEADAILQRGLRLAQSMDPPQPIGTETLHIGLSHIHRERGELETAARDLEMAWNLGEQVDLPDWRHRWFIARAKLSESQGDFEQAFDLLESAARHHVRTPVPNVRPIPALKARVQVKRGKVIEARQWADELGLSAADEPTYLNEFAHLTLARALIAQGQRDRDPDLIHAAQDVLDRHFAIAESAGRVGSQIDILVLKALAYEAQNNLPGALKPLSLALSLAEPEGYVRVFVDEGPPMARLLYEALAAGSSSAYTQRLLEAFPGLKRRLPADANEVHGPGLEPLSDRERDVLRLLAEGLSNQDIGDRLFLALNTVKAHTRSIYGKLGVNSRTQAIARARVLGILTAN